MKKTLLLIFCLAVCLGIAQAGNGGDGWAADSAWFRSCDVPNNGKIDLLYLVSTNVLSATNSSGEKVYRAQLTPADRRILEYEFAYVDRCIGKGDFNYFAPYYHQFTLDALHLHRKEFEVVYKEVAKEVCESFDYYMKHLNNGRPFALVGFSQGAMLVLDLLKHMSARQYRQLVAAYAIGYRISADDMKCRHIVPATDETTRGVTVSFNSVLNDSSLWQTVAGNAATAINPVNWTTDSTSATFTYEGTPHEVHLSPATHQLIVKTPRADEYRKWNANPAFQSVHVPLGCLHHWDLLFYTDFIHDNILRRAEGKYKIHSIHKKRAESPTVASPV